MCNCLIPVLLSLQPAFSNTEMSPICISLKESSLDDHVPYEPVSYTWALENGHRERSIPIKWGGFIMVTANCEAALRRLRNTNSERILWVDAICINQDDPTERSQQVTLMRDIYRNASNILVWLGKASIECDPDTSQLYSDIGIDYLHRLGYEEIQRSELDEESDRFTGPLYSVLRELRRRDMEDAIARSPDFHGLITILSYSFWNRVWVIQELTLAPSFLLFCGKATLQGSELEAFLATVMQDDQQEFQSDFVRLFVVFYIRVFTQDKALIMENFKRSTLLGYLGFTRGSSASDPRDQI